MEQVKFFFLSNWILFNITWIIELLVSLQNNLTPNCKELKKSNNGTSQKKPRFPASLKRKIVQEYRVGMFTQAEICDRYQISPMQLGIWNRWYEHTYLNPYYKQAMKNREKQKDDIKRLKREADELYKLLNEARLSNEVLEQLIRVADRELGISLKKNFGSKRLPK